MSGMSRKMPQAAGRCLQRCPPTISHKSKDLVEALFHVLQKKSVDFTDAQVMSLAFVQPLHGAAPLPLLRAQQTPPKAGPVMQAACKHSKQWQTQGV